MVMRPKSMATVVVTFWSTPVGVVHRLAGFAEQFLGAQRLDLADRAHQGGLAHAEAAGDQYLQRQGGRVAGWRRSARRPSITSLGSAGNGRRLYGEAAS